MQLVVDENNKIVNFALIGDIENSIEVELDPDTEKHFISSFEPKKFLYKNGELVEDDKYKAPLKESIPQVSATQQALGAMMKQIADLAEAQKQSSNNDKTQVELGAVSKQVAMLTKQNLQLQQALGTLTLQLAKEDK